MNDHGNSSAFLKLKPLCVNFLRQCTIQNINELEKVVKELDSASVELLNEFIVLPFIVHLNTKLNETIAIKCIDFLTLIFKKIEVKAWKFFTDIFGILILRISNVQDLNKTCGASEELKSSVCECISCLICCSSEEILNEMYSLSFRPILGHAFFALNVMLREEKSKTLLKTVLQTMGGLTYNERYLRKKYRITELIASESLASCLPGLSNSLQKVIIGDDKQAHSIIIMALNILTNLIILVVGDESSERGIAKDISSDIHCIAYKSGKFSLFHDTCFNDAIPVVLKNEAWFKSVAENLEVIIKNLTCVSTHDHWKVRLEILKCSESLLFYCNKTLENCISLLLPVIFGLTVDSNAIVSSNAKCTLVALSKKLQSMNCIRLNASVEDNIEKLIAQLIKCKFTAIDNRKLSILKSLLGYIALSDASLNKLVFSATFLQRIILTLIILIEFDISELNLIEELPVIESFQTTHLLWPKKIFKFFKNEEILSIICRICYSLGQIGNYRVLIEYLLENLSSNNLHTLQCIFVIGNVVKGLAKKSDFSQNYSTLISDILEVFLSPELFNAPICNNNSFNVQRQNNKPSFELDLSNNILNKNKLQICLLLEAIANCSECLKTDFKLHLMKVLCPVMEKAGSSNHVISHCGRLCLYYIANFCQHKSVLELIKDNADYITNLIMINFQEYLHKPEIAVVLRIAMEYSDAEAVLLFRDLIFQILDVLDFNQDNAYPLVHVLYFVAVCIKKWFPCKEDHLIPKTSEISNVHKNLNNAIKDYIILKKTAFESESCNFFEETVSDSELENSEKEYLQDEDNYVIDEKKPEVSLHINIICEIFKRCINLQSSGNAYVRTLTLEIVEICIFVLRDYENQLHPLIHKFWNPFLRRFTEDTLIYKAFNVLLTIANECGDFIRSRTFKDVIPKLVIFLQQEYPKSCSKYSFKQYQWTNDHSLQILLLSEIGNLCTKLHIDDKDVNTVATVCVSYLKKEQPKVLQEAAAKSLKALTIIDSDAVWFYWNTAFCEDDVLTPPHDALLKLSFQHCNKSSTSILIDL